MAQAEAGKTGTGKKETPSQTAGPYVHIALDTAAAGLKPVYGRHLSTDIAGPDAKGEWIAITGTIFDGAGEPLRDAVLEVWQADANGIYNAPTDPRQESADPDVAGWGRVTCDLTTGAFAIDTVKPGAVTGPDGRTMAPHICLWIVARGINIGLSTRIYFPEDSDAQAADPVLAYVEGERRSTLIATPTGFDEGKAGYRFDIHLQGEDETVFFDA